VHDNLVTDNQKPESANRRSTTAESVMKAKHPALGATLCVAISLLLGMPARASAQTILVYDDFSTAGDVNGNRTPNTTTIEGRKYTRVVANENATYTTNVIISGVGYAAMRGNVGGAILITSENGYTKPDGFEISATFNINTVANNAPARTGRGVYLGFWSSLPMASDSMTGMYGVFVNPDGRLVLWNGGSAANNTTVTTLAYAGTWDASAWHTMSYKIDIDGSTTGNAGSIHDFILDGKSYDWGIVSLFTEENTKYAGFGVSDSTGNGIGYFDSWSLFAITVPEPAAQALITGVLALAALIAARHIRNRKHSHD
jgi:hypothetical protein